MQAPYDAREVGNYVLRLAKASDIEVTQMSLLKIVFYAHGWYLASKDAPLVKQPIEAWEYGPVIKVLRDAFKDFGRRPIDRYAERLDLFTGEFVTVESRLAESDENFLDSIFTMYSHRSAFELSDMTHERGSPWDKVWNSKEAVGRMGLRIKNTEIREYFLQLGERQQRH